MSNYTHVYFEGLGIDFNIPSVAFTVGSYEIHWYGIIIAFGFALAVLYGGRMAYKWKMSLDGMTDVLICGTILGIICARLYYVAFEWSYYSVHLSEIPMIWNGGIAIYGGIIGALIGAAIGCKIGKIDFFNLLDLGAVGLLIGQGIGRWGNFFNQEAFGCNTKTALFRMWSPKIRDTLSASSDLLASKGVSVDPSAPVHPTFLYESVWCIIGFFLLSYILRKKRKFKGEVFILYGMWYGLERAVVEGLRTDSLYIGATNIRVSQLLSAVIAAAALICFVIIMIKLKNGNLPDKLKIQPIVDAPKNDKDNEPTVYGENDRMEQQLSTYETKLNDLLSQNELNDDTAADNITDKYYKTTNDDNLFDNIKETPNRVDEVNTQANIDSTIPQDVNENKSEDVSNDSN